MVTILVQFCLLKKLTDHLFLLFNKRQPERKFLAILSANLISNNIYHSVFFKQVYTVLSFHYFKQNRMLKIQRNKLICLEHNFDDSREFSLVT